MDDKTNIRLMVVDDQELMRDGLVSILERQPGIIVVATAANGEEAIQHALEIVPDVVLMDVRMPVMNGVDATAQLRKSLPNVQVLMLTTFDDEGYIIDALRAGAVGYILKNIPAKDLAEAVSLAHRGIYQLDPAAAAKLIPALGANSVISPSPLKSSPSSHISNLTERENEVILLVARGDSNREIAEKLFISEGTVKSHISSILSQLGLRDRTQLAVYVYQHHRTSIS